MKRKSPEASQLVRALLEMDEKLPRGGAMPDDAPRPAWCAVLCADMQSPGGECCGICGTLSQITREALDRAFGSKQDALRV